MKDEEYDLKEIEGEEGQRRRGWRSDERREGGEELEMKFEYE